MHLCANIFSFLLARALLSLQRQINLRKRFRTAPRLFYLEIIPKGPGPQHLKEGVVVHIFPHIIQVVVLAPCSDALLSVGGSAQFSERVWGVDGIEEDGFELWGEKKGTWTARKAEKLRKALKTCFQMLKQQQGSVIYVMISLIWTYPKHLSETNPLLLSMRRLPRTQHSHTHRCSQSPPNPRPSKGTESCQIHSYQKIKNWVQLLICSRALGASQFQSLFKDTISHLCQGCCGTKETRLAELPP